MVIVLKIRHIDNYLCTAKYILNTSWFRKSWVILTIFGVTNDNQHFKPVRNDDSAIIPNIIHKTTLLIIISNMTDTGTVH